MRLKYARETASTEGEEWVNYTIIVGIFEYAIENMRYIYFYIFF